MTDKYIAAFDAGTDASGERLAQRRKDARLRVVQQLLHIPLSTLGIAAAAGGLTMVDVVHIIAD